MSTVAKAIALAVEAVSAKIIQINHDNEGFDGEITPVDLARMALESFAKRTLTAAPPAPRPVVEARPDTHKRGSKKGCKYCGATDVKWTQSDEGRWTLLNADESRHLCRREMRQAAAAPVTTTTTEQSKIESFTETLRKV